MALTYSMRARDVLEQVLAIYARQETAGPSPHAESLRLAHRAMLAVEILITRKWAISLPWPAEGDLVDKIIENERRQYDDEQGPLPQ